MNAPLQVERLIGPLEAFDAWALPLVDSWHQSEGKEGFSPDTADHYRQIWLDWCAWLDGRSGQHLQHAQFRWLVAGPHDVTAFLTGPVKTRTRAAKGANLANFSRRSYWRVLRDVYANAAMSDLRADNPMALVRAPGLAAADRMPQCVDPVLLAMLQDPAALRRLVPDRAPRWLAVRDRAAISLVAHCALTAGELQGLTGHDLRLPNRRQATIPGLTPLDCAKVDLPGGRSLTVPEQIHGVLFEWMEERREVLDGLHERALEDAKALRSDLSKVVFAPAHRQPLFLGREAPDGSPCGVPPPTVHLIFSRAIKAAHEVLTASGQIQPGTYNATGPASVRNSVIRAWVREHGAPAAATWAGLKSVRGRYD